MRVALFAPSARAGDAIGSQVAAKVRYFVERAWTVRICLASAAHVRPELVPYLAETRLLIETGFLKCADLIVAEYGVASDLLNLLPLLAKGKSRIVVDYHGVTPSELWNAAHRQRLVDAERQRGVVWCADMAIAHSHFTAEELHRATGYPRERIQQIPCAVDLDRFTPGEPRIDVRTRLGLDEDAVVLLFVGRLAANKRPRLLVEAVARLLAGRASDGSNPCLRVGLTSVSPVHAVFLGDDTDIYADEARACGELAERLGVSNKVHLLGAVDEATLLSWYRSADLLVMPSLHEGFCLPVVEAMACGLPVVAARAAALPETIGDGGLTFDPNDVEDLTRQARRVLESRSNQRAPTLHEQRVAVVSPRFGDGFVGGAETSLRTIAAVLQEEGCRVEVFTTCNRHDSHWANDLTAGTTTVDGMTVHRYPIDLHIRERHLRAVEVFRRGQFTDAVAAEYLQNSLNSHALVDALADRAGEFGAIIVGPYLFGLTWNVARRISDRVLLLPCFHDEPLARLRSFREAYQAVGGMLYHSPEEQALAEVTLGINHPYATVIGTWLNLKAETRNPKSEAHPYLVYCGRYSVEKGVDRLLEYAERYAAQHPDHFDFVFVGQGSLTIPDRPRIINQGFVSEHVKREILSGASALVQLSVNESLSLVALEAWSAGVPVIGHRDCAVIRGQIERSGGGRAIRDYAEFAAALDSLWANPEQWREAGASGRRYLEEHYASRPAFAARLIAALEQPRTPLDERLRQNGLRRARQYRHDAWERAFGKLIAGAMAEDGARRDRRVELEIAPVVTRKTVNPESETVLIPVTVTNRGTLPAMADGPARVALGYRMTNSAGERCSDARLQVPLPELLPPGQSLVTVIPVSVPTAAGAYQVSFTTPLEQDTMAKEHILELVVDGGVSGSEMPSLCAPFVASAQHTLAEAHALKTLPEDYTDVTEGAFAKWKRLIKRKLLHNFRHAYVDVLSRQQSAFNEKVLTALCHLADGVAAIRQADTSADRLGDLALLQARWKRERRRGRQLQREIAECRLQIEELRAQLVDILQGPSSTNPKSEICNLKSYTEVLS